MLPPALAGFQWFFCSFPMLVSVSVPKWYLHSHSPNPPRSFPNANFTLLKGSKLLSLRFLHKRICLFTTTYTVLLMTLLTLDFFFTLAYSPGFYWLFRLWLPNIYFCVFSLPDLYIYIFNCLLNTFIYRRNFSKLTCQKWIHILNSNWLQAGFYSLFLLCNHHPSRFFPFLCPLSPHSISQQVLHFCPLYISGISQLSATLVPWSWSDIHWGLRSFTLGSSVVGSCRLLPAPLL
jgi:hypothetical protein